MCSMQIDAIQNALVLGYGALGRATIYKLERAKDSSFESCFVVDPNGENLKTWRKPIKDKDGMPSSVKKFTWSTKLAYIPETELPFVVFVCVPSDILLDTLVKLADKALPVGSVVIIRTTTSPEMWYDFNQYTLGNTLENAFPHLVYLPEYATDQMLLDGMIETQQYWASTDFAEEFLCDRLYIMHPRRVDTLKEATLHKLLTNGLLATIYSFRNAAALLYRSYGLGHTRFGLDTGLAGDILSSQMPIPLAFGGKCMHSSLRVLEAATLDKSNDDDTHWGALMRVNDKRMSQLRKLIITFVLLEDRGRARSKDKKTQLKTLNKICAVFGINSHVDQPDYQSVNSPAELLMKGQEDFFKVSPLNTKLKKGLTLPSQSIAASYAVFVQPVTQRVAHVQKLLKASVDTNNPNKLYSLTVFDPLYQFTDSEMARLKKYAASLSSPEPLVLAFVSDIYNALGSLR
jgi:hypothetical protein